MNIRDLDYELPERLIAQRPLDRRDESRLMVLRREGATIEHRQFRDLPELLRAGDLLVCNDTRVVPAKFFARRETGARLEGLFLREPTRGIWEVLLTKSRRIKVGELLLLCADEFGLHMEESLGDGRWRARVEPDQPAEDVLNRIGITPLPHYIHREAHDVNAEAEDRLRYQTMFARQPGAVAAPTAGLHFTDALLDRLQNAGIRRTTVTLHVGMGTFLPISTTRLDQHPMHSEWFSVPAESANLCAHTREKGGRIIAVGTTSARTLESCAGENGVPTAGSATTDLFIYPPYRFKAIDGMITNFHLPRSTLLALVFAMAGREFALEAYRQAIERKYRFFSYGDAMLLL